MAPTGSPLIAGGYDVDPISPGLQTAPGVLTATGPSRVVGGGVLGGGMLASGYQNVGFGGVGFGGAGVVDADPITPGIQSQPGIVTPTGPPRIVGGPGAVAGGLLNSGVMMSGFGGVSGFNGVGGVGVSGVNTGLIGGVGVSGINTGLIGGGAVVDADPLTPGIQSQPGVVTATGPSRIVGTTGAIGSALGGGLISSGVTPGFPGTVPAGLAASGVYASRAGIPGYRNCACCPWWLWTILGLLLLTALVGGLYSLNGNTFGKGIKKETKNIK